MRIVDLLKAFNSLNFERRKCSHEDSLSDGQAVFVLVK